MSDTVELDIDGRARETDAAVLFSNDDFDFWVPKSLIKSETKTMVEVPEWFAIQEGLA